MNKIIFIGGATAAGKSDLAVKLALENNAEVISADSRQIYIGLDIGSGKIKVEEMQGVPHHMLSIIEPETPYSVALYQKEALACIEDIFSRNKNVVVCGGTGYYFDSLFYKKEFPEVLPNEQLRAELANKTVEELQVILDEETNGDIANIDVNHKQRLIRAIEINHALGFIPKINTEKRFKDSKIIILDLPKEEHQRRILDRIDARKDTMIAEIMQLLEKGVSKDWLISLGLEYTYVTKHVLGELSWDECKELLATKTWQYAKRQKTWFKKYQTISTENSQ